MKIRMLTFYHGEPSLPHSRAERPEEETSRSIFAQQTARGAEEEDGASAELQKSALLPA